MSLRSAGSPIFTATADTFIILRPLCPSYGLVTLCVGVIQRSVCLAFTLCVFRLKLIRYFKVIWYHRYLIFLVLLFANISYDLSLNLNVIANYLCFIFVQYEKFSVFICFVNLYPYVID